VLDVLDAQLDGTTRRRVEAADVELHRDRLPFLRSSAATMRVWHGRSRCCGSASAG
jgi:hypothetical protein